LTALVVLGIVLGLLVLGLCIPLEVSFYASGCNLKGKFSWLFGLISRDISYSRRQGGTPIRPCDLNNLFRIEGLLGNVRNLISSILKSSQVSECDVYLKYGLADPAATGVSYALLMPMACGLNTLPHCHIDVEPSFLDLAFETEALLKVRLLPVRILPPALRFIFSPGGIQLLRYYWHHSR